MGLYFRKSIRVGPIRFNLSKSGAGVSTGVRGFRVGVGPRGTYIHMGRGGIYYRKTLSSPAQRRQSGQGNEAANQTAKLPAEDFAAGDSELRVITSSDVSLMCDSSSASLVEELNEKRRKPRLFPIALAIAAIAVLVAAGTGAPAWVTILVGTLGASLAFLAYERDVLAKTVVLFYDLEPAIESAYESLLAAIDDAAQCARVWHVDAEGDVSDPKYHAGAGKLVRRKPVSFGRASPPYVQTNVKVAGVPAGRRSLCLFPDRLLVFGPEGVGTVGYDQLAIEADSIRFVEDGGVPRDATIVDRTWKYVNRSGGPDKRFKDNHEIPICLYDQAHLRSRSGLNELFQLSQAGTADRLRSAVQELGKVISRRELQSGASNAQITQEVGPVLRTLLEIGDAIRSSVGRSLGAANRFLRKLAGEDVFMYRFLQIVAIVVALAALAVTSIAILR